MNIAALVVLVLLQLSDAYTTHLVLAKGGYEANPIMRWVLDKAGFGGMFVVKGLMVALLSYFLVTGLIHIALVWAACAVFAYVTFTNYKVYRGME